MNQPIAMATSAIASQTMAASTGANSGSGAITTSQCISFAVGDDQCGVDIMAVRSR